ncbi:capsule assembly Wzi family protein [Candidatus Marinimicrobia bacterium]|nr:capsule assembly Wzi family protein [Candidatus Neomarinimicrobiota bacterium]
MENLLEKSLLKYSLFALFILFAFNTLQAQDKNSSLKIKLNPTGQNYWWLEKNNFGKSVLNTEFEYILELKKINTSYKINISNSYKNTNYTLDENNNFTHRESGKIIYLGESFIKQSFSQNLFIKAGKYYRDFSLYLNDKLSSGSMLISKNAQPMPKIGLVGNYKLKKRDINFRYGLAHGFFRKNAFYSEKAPYLHEKFIYLDLNKGDYQFSFGFVHDAMWGGATPKIGSLPSSFKDFLKVIIAADGPPGLNTDNPNYHQNSIGNHLGIWDFYYQKTKINNQKLKLYYQHFFEDTSGLRFANKTDGLWGIELVNYIKDTTIVLEYMDTSNAYDNPPYQRDRYYWNYQYRLGWSYQGNIIGNPYVNTNRVDDTNLVDLKELTQLFHLGVIGKLNSEIDYTLLASKRVNVHDNINYKISLTRKINNKLHLRVDTVNMNTKKGLSAGLTYIF